MLRRIECRYCILSFLLKTWVLERDLWDGFTHACMAYGDLRFEGKGLARSVREMHWSLLGLVSVIGGV